MSTSRKFCHKIFERMMLDDLCHLSGSDVCIKDFMKQSRAAKQSQKSL